MAQKMNTDTYNIWYNAFLNTLATFNLCERVRLDAELLRDIFPICKDCSNPNCSVKDKQFEEFYMLSREFDRIYVQIYVLHLNVQYSAQLPSEFQKTFLKTVEALFKMNWNKLW